jgi:hypothetical protein
MKKPKITDNQLIQNAIFARGEFLRNLIDKTKDIDKECGYEEILTIAYLRQMYDREGIAKRVVRIFPEECWKQDPEILETDDEGDTQFEKDWDALQKKFKLYSILQRADVMSGIGTFGVILLGITDGKQFIEPVDGVPLDGTMPTTFPKGSRAQKLAYLRVFDESAVTINKFELDITSPRYGRPLLYNINFIQYGVNTQVIQPVAPMPTSPTPVHWTRVIHLADNKESSEVYGVPRLASVANRIVDLRKVLGGAGEMFYKGGFPGISFEVNPELQAVSTLNREEMREEFEKYQSGLQRYLALVGVTAKSMALQVADPTAHFTTAIKAIACSLGIPWRVFIGTEEAKLAADQDASAWNERVTNRQTKYLTPDVITPFVERLIIMGILSPLDDMDAGLVVNWADPHTTSDTEKAQIAFQMSQAMGAYVSGGCDVLVPPKQYLTMFLNFTDEEADAIMANVKKYLNTMGNGGQADILHPPQPDPNAPGADGQPPPAGGSPLPNAGKGGTKATQVDNFPNQGNPYQQPKPGKTQSKIPSAVKPPPAAPPLKGSPTPGSGGKKPVKNEEEHVSNIRIMQKRKEAAFASNEAVEQGTIADHMKDIAHHKAAATLHNEASELLKDDQPNAAAWHDAEADRHLTAITELQRGGARAGAGRKPTKGGEQQSTALKDKEKAAVDRIEAFYKKGNKKGGSGGKDKLPKGKGVKK